MTDSPEATQASSSLGSPGSLGSPVVTQLPLSSSAAGLQPVAYPNWPQSVEEGSKLVVLAAPQGAAATAGMHGAFAALGQEVTARSTIPQLNPPVRILMGPGPSDVHPRVLQALGAPTVGHLDPYYLALMGRMQDMLRWLFGTRNPMTFAVSGTGSAGMEAAIANVVEPGDPIVVCINGVFGGRMAEMAERAGAVVTRVERTWGEIFAPADLEPVLQSVKPKVVALVMAETSTGALQPLEEISKLVHDAGALLVVDAVTALGGIPVEVDRLGIDVVFAGTQKCLSCPPGLSPMSFGERAMQVVMSRPTKAHTWYLDVRMLAQYWGAERVYHHTAPINMTYGLYEALRLVHEEGMEAVFARHALNSQALAAGLEAMGLRYVGKAGQRLPMLHAVAVPGGIDEARVRRSLLDRYGIEIGGGLGIFKGKIWRIGLMGHSSRVTNVIMLLGALEALLLEQDCNCVPGSAVVAANEVYRASQQPGLGNTRAT